MFIQNVSVDFQRATWFYISEGRTLHNHRCENLKPDAVYETMWSEKRLWGRVMSKLSVKKKEGSSVGTAADSIAGRGKIFLYSTGSRPDLGPIQPIQRVSGGLGD
jgi:hypothetical protein